MTSENERAKEILLCEDTESQRLVVTKVLKDKGFKVKACQSGEEALSLYDGSRYDLVLLDINLPGIDGVETFQRLQEKNPKVSVILMTAFSSVEQSVRVFKMGALNYLAKPFSNSSLVAAVEEVLVSRQEKWDQNLDHDLVLGTKSENVKQIYTMLDKFAGTSLSIILLGESGTGKERVAQYLHEHSPRNDKPFIAVDCPSIPDTLFESEMFGHTVGAFTGASTSKIGKFERANSGTVFFDEVGDLSANAQSKLLRAIQEREVEPLGGDTKKKIDIRVISATSRDLGKEVTEERFRADLYYRLAEFEITLPPLRKRKVDLPLFVDFFLKKFCQESSVSKKTLSDQAMEQLFEYDWPGNIRELKTVIHRLVILNSDVDLITSVPREFLVGIRASGVRSAPSPSRGEAGTQPSVQPNDFSSVERGEGVSQSDDSRLTFRENEVILIQKALRKTGNNMTKASELLNISRTTLYRKIKRLKISVED